MLRPLIPGLGARIPYVYPTSDSTTAWQVRKADAATMLLNVDSTNSRVGIGQAAPAAPLHIGGSTTNNSSDAMVCASRAVDDTVVGNGHCYTDSSAITRTGTMAYNSYDARVTIGNSTSVAYDHFVGFQNIPTYQSTGTISELYGVYDGPIISSGTVTEMRSVTSAPIVNGGTVSTRYGVIVEDATGAGTVTTQYGFYCGALAKGAANWGVFSGTSCGFGGTSGNVWVYVGNTSVTIPNTTNVSQYGIYAHLTSNSSATSNSIGIATTAATTAASYTCTNAIGLHVLTAVKGSTSTITNCYGILINAQTVGTNNYGLRCLVAAASARWNLYIDGTANNHFNANMLIGTTTIPTNATFSLVLGGGSTSPAAPTATADIATISPIDTSAGHRNIYIQSEAGSSIFLGDDKLSFQGTTGYLAQNNTNVLAVTATAFGYATGQGGTVTQGTSRTTTVQVDKACGAITLVSAAGTASWQSFTVTNSTVAATDVVRVCQKSGTDKNMVFVTAVGAGSFEITFATTGGTTTEQPVFNFTVIKAVTS